MAPRTSTPTPVAYVVGVLCVAICIWGVSGEPDLSEPSGAAFAASPALSAPRTPSDQPITAAQADAVQHATLEALRVVGVVGTGAVEAAALPTSHERTPTRAGELELEPLSDPGTPDLVAEPTPARQLTLDPPGSGSAPSWSRTGAWGAASDRPAPLQLAAADSRRSRENARRAPLVDLLDTEARTEALRRRSLDAAHLYWTTGGMGQVQVVLDRSLDDFAAATRDGVRYEVHFNPDLLEGEPRAVIDFFERHEYGHAYLGHPFRTSGHPWVDEHAADAFAASLLWFQQGTAPVREVIQWFERENAPATRTHPSYRSRARYLRSVLEALDIPGRSLPDPPAVAAAAPAPATLQRLGDESPAMRRAAAGLHRVAATASGSAPVVAADFERATD